MKDGKFILDMLKKGDDAREKAKEAFSGLSVNQLNWKPAAEKWSIAQCLDHLIVSDCLYFPAFKKITAGNYEMSFWENWNPLAPFFGKMLASQVEEKPAKKLNAPRLFLPSETMIDGGVLDRFHKHLDSLLEYIADSHKTDLDKVHITSPVSRVVTYSLRLGITILVQHEHRHINQAIKIKGAPAFPLL